VFVSVVTPATPSVPDNVVAPATPKMPVLEVFVSVVTPATPSVPVLEEATKVVVPPINRFPVFDCDPVIKRAFDIFAAAPIPTFAATVRVEVFD
jgi:hypothetical protein